VRVEGTTSRADTRAECEMIIVAQVHVVALEEGRPAPREHPFNAATGRPACSGVAVAAEGQTSYGDVCAGLNPGRAALTVEQPARRERVTEAARQSVEPIEVAADRAGGTKGWIKEISTPIHARPVKHIAEADDPSAAKLIIAANLTAACEARIVARDFHTIKSRRAVGKYPADVGADVTSGPSDWRWRGRHIGRSFSWQISSQCLRRS